MASPDPLVLVSDADATLARIKSQIFRLGLKTQAEGASILSSKGRPQNWLIDMRRLFLHRDTLELIAREFWKKFQHEPVFQVAGMETAAIPLLTAITIYAPKERGVVNAVIVRKERKITGLCNPIEGELTGLPVVLVDDILNSGGSAEKARAVIAQAGHRVWKAFAVVDYRSQRGLRWREDNDIDVTSLFNLDDLNLELAKGPRPPTQRYKDLWHTEIPGGFPFNVVPKSPPILRENVIYRGCDAGKLHAFDALTGNIKWEFVVKGTGRKGIMSAPLVHDGRVYFGAFNGAIYCVDAATGMEIWSHSYGEWVGASPIAVPKHGLVYFGIEYARPWARGSIGAFSLDTGDRVWEHLVKKLQHGSPAYWQGGDLILWGSADHEMVALDAGTGDVAWVFPTRRSVKYAPAIDEERGYCAFASFDTSIYVLDVRNGKKLGEWPTGEICYTTPLIHQNRLFCGSGDRHFYVIDLDRMELVKKMDMGGRVYSSPKLIDGRVVFATTGGVVIEMDPHTLETIGRLQLPDAVTNAVAATEDGRRIFVSTYMNHLYAFERLNVGPNPSSRQPAAPLEPLLSPPPPRVNFRLLGVCETVDALLQEVLTQPELWKVSTVRQTTIPVQRETESIFLRAAQRKPDSPIPVEDTHASARTVLAEKFPNIMAWIEAFARDQNAQLSRVLLAKLQPQGQVYRHHDHGEYYRVRDRYHLVLQSAKGSPMVCGQESVVMKPGEVWWFDNKKPHEAFNRSDEQRIHLIFDLLSHTQVSQTYQTSAL